MADFELNWKGDEVLRTTKENAAKIIAEFALTVEGESKKELRKGHGVLTGTLRRSIHTALPDASSSDQLTVEVGSGLDYAMAVHQGHHNFSGYHYLTIGLKKAKEKMQSIIARHQVKR